MLIVDLNRPDGRVERVGVIGSCRVLTPMAKMIALKVARRVWHACRCYSYTAPEAVQHLAHCLGRVEIPADLAPYVLNDPMPARFTPEWTEVIESCRTVIVEVSTLEDFVFNGLVFNCLGLANLLVRGHGAVAMDWFRRLSPEPPDDETARLMEAALAGSGVDLTANLRAMLRGMCRKANDAGTFARAIRSIVCNADKRWVFVPMFNVSTRPDEQIVARAALRAMLEREALANGAELFDPTPLVEEAGRSVAFEGAMASPIHYAPAFDAIVGEALIRCVLDEGRQGGYA